MVHIENGQKADHAEVTLSLDELRVLVHRLAPEGSFLHHQAEGLLPDGHEEIADHLSEELRRFHDRHMNRTS
jgi:hypothetical protein